MVTNGNSTRDGNLHRHNLGHGHGLGPSVAEEESGLITDCASERSFGSEHRFKKWSSNRGSFLNQPHASEFSNANTSLFIEIHEDQDPDAHRNDGVSHQINRLFHKSSASADFRSRDRSLPSHGCDACENPIIAIKGQLKVLLSFKNSLSLIFALVAIIFSALDAPALLVFIWNLIAIVPLSITLTFATERLAQDLGETAGALLNISLGNLAELIIL